VVLGEVAKGADLAGGDRSMRSWPWQRKAGDAELVRAHRLREEEGTTSPSDRQREDEAHGAAAACAARGSDVAGGPCHFSDFSRFSIFQI
jgi:hypothetical protein